MATPHFTNRSDVEIELCDLACQGVAPITQEFGSLLPAPASGSQSGSDQDAFGRFDRLFGDVDMALTKLITCRESLG